MRIFGFPFADVPASHLLRGRPRSVGHRPVPPPPQHHSQVRIRSRRHGVSERTGGPRDINGTGNGGDKMPLLCRHYPRRAFACGAGRVRRPPGHPAQRSAEAAVAAASVGHQFRAWSPAGPGQARPGHVGTRPPSATEPAAGAEPGQAPCLRRRARAAAERACGSGQPTFKTRPQRSRPDPPIA
jgi:hypothetical protein